MSWSRPARGELYESLQQTVGLVTHVRAKIYWIETGEEQWIDYPRIFAILREAGYDGELRAVGDVLVDQVAYMRRCGFDAFEPDSALDEGDLKAALDRWPEVYQKAADGRTTIWSKRHA